MKEGEYGGEDKRGNKREREGKEGERARETERSCFRCGRSEGEKKSCGASNLEAHSVVDERMGETGGQGAKRMRRERRYAEG